MYKKGNDLVKGERVTPIAGDYGVASEQQQRNVFTVTDMTDKKGNPIIVSDDGTSAVAGPNSVWSV